MWNLTVFSRVYDVEIIDALLGKEPFYLAQGQDPLISYSNQRRILVEVPRICYVRVDPVLHEIDS